MDTSLKPGVYYYYAVTANVGGQVGSPSDAVLASAAPNATLLTDSLDDWGSTFRNTLPPPRRRLRCYCRSAYRLQFRRPTPCRSTIPERFPAPPVTPAPNQSSSVSNLQLNRRIPKPPQTRGLWLFEELPRNCLKRLRIGRRQRRGQFIIAYRRLIPRQSTRIPSIVTDRYINHKCADITL